MLLSRAKYYILEKLRNRHPDTASDALLERTQRALAQRGPFSAGDRIRIGPEECSLEVSRLALGTGSNGWAGSSNQTRKLGADGVADLFQRAYEEHNVNFWDSADQYGSHPHLRKALERVERNKVVILTKTVAETEKAMRRDLDRFRKELGTEVIDILLLHCMTAPDWPRRLRPVMDVISEAQENGTVRIKGVSCHSFGALKAAAGEPWVDLDLARINLAGVSMDAGPDEVVRVLDQMKDAGKTVMGMKVFGNGTLAEMKSECLRFVLGLDCVDCFTIGFESLKEMETVVEEISHSSAD